MKRSHFRLTVISLLPSFILLSLKYIATQMKPLLIASPRYQHNRYRPAAITLCISLVGCAAQRQHSSLFCHKYVDVGVLISINQSINQSINLLNNT